MAHEQPICLTSKNVWNMHNMRVWITCKTVWQRRSFLYDSTNCLAHEPCVCMTSKRKKCTLVQALRLCTGRTVHRGSKGIALLFHDHGTRGWGVSVTPPPLFTTRKDPVPIVPEAGWAPGPVWTGAENLARPARSQSLYRLRYPAHTSKRTTHENLRPWLLKT